MPLRLLIVDDNAHFREAASGLLEQEGIAVVAVASTSAEALERVAELRPDAALVDVDLGEESGFDLAIRLADASSGDGFRVVLISTYAEHDLRDLVEASPAVGFLSKANLSGPAIRRLLGPRDSNDATQRPATSP
jgi:CheY-like chemotaxis protein